MLNADGSIAVVRPQTPVESKPLPPPVPPARTEQGYVEWNNLQLCPPPPLYRPFVALDEEKKATRKQTLKEKFGKFVCFLSFLAVKISIQHSHFSCF
jgi:hypothetical protein